MVYLACGFGWLVLLIILTVALMYWIRNRIGKDNLRQNHEVIGFVYAVVGSIFAVNIALVVDTVHDEFILAEKQAAHEAAQIGVIYRLAGWFDNPAGKMLQQQVKRYNRLIITEEWPRMIRVKERGSPAAERQIKRIAATAKSLPVNTMRQNVAYAELLQRLSDLEDTRELRLHGERVNLPFGLVIVVVCGSCIIISFSILFGMNNHRMQALIVSLVSILVWGNIMLVFTVRYPFNGIYTLPPSAFIEMEKKM